MGFSDQMIELNSQNAEIVAESDRPLNAFAAELTLRNMAVIADRLVPSLFSKLSTEAVDSVLETASLAKDITGMKGREVEKIPHESDGEYQYRTAVKEPLHAVQQKLYTREFDPDDLFEIDRLKSVVDLAGAAFSLVYAETREFVAVKNARNYFWDNASAASKQLERG